MPMRLKTRRLLKRGSDLRHRASLEIGPTGPKVAFADSALKIIDDVLIEFQSKAVLYEEWEFESPQLVNGSLNDMRRVCVSARQRLSGKEPLLSAPLDEVEQICGRFVHRHPAVAGIADMSKPLPADVMDDLLELRVEIAEIVDGIYRETGLPSAQHLFNRIEFEKEPRAPWLAEGQIDG